jgi:hypothetical protein
MSETQTTLLSRRVLLIAWGLLATISVGLFEHAIYGAVLEWLKGHVYAEMIALFSSYTIPMAGSGAVCALVYLAAYVHGTYATSQQRSSGLSDQLSVFPPEHLLCGEQGDLYNEVKRLYNDKYNGAATFYHYSGTMVHELIVMLFKHGFTIRLFVENPDTAHNLGCDYQKQRIETMIAQLRNELPQSGQRGRIEIRQSEAPLTLRAALFNNQHIVLGWYMYQLLTKPMKGFPNDRIAVWGHEGWGLIMDDQHQQFKSARKFLEDYEMRICAKKLWLYPSGG